MEAQSLTLHRWQLPRPRPLLAALSDERLATELKRGNETAFAVLYDRHHRGLLALCRHLLRSREDAEDALQQTLASAFGALRSSHQPPQVKPWLYVIARNRCLTMLRARRETPVEEVVQDAGSGLSEEVERRTELRELLADLDHLPERQKTALVLSEVGALDHAQIAQVLQCETKQVKALVFQARSALIEDRRAREIPCADIREQLATASAGELRRSSLRRHVRVCSGCAEFRDEIRRQRKLLAVALPVVPSFGLRESALAAAGFGGGGAAGGIGGGGAAGGGGLIAALGSHGAAKVAAIALATGGAVTGAVVAEPQLNGKSPVASERGTDEGREGAAGRSVGNRRFSNAGRVKGSTDSETARGRTRDEPRRDETGADEKLGPEARTEGLEQGGARGVARPAPTHRGVVPDEAGGVVATPPEGRARGRSGAAASRNHQDRGRRGASRSKPKSSARGGGPKGRGRSASNRRGASGRRGLRGLLRSGGKGGRAAPPPGLLRRSQPPGRGRAG